MPNPLAILGIRFNQPTPEQNPQMDEQPYAPYSSPQSAPLPRMPAPLPVQQLTDHQKLDQKHRQGAGWFLWVGLLSQLNSLFMLLQVNFAFCIGLGISPLVAGVVTAAENPQAKELTTSARGAGFAVGLFGFLFYLIIFFFANRRHSWAFILGMLVYFLDGLIFLLFQDYLSIAFHLFALYWMFIGLKSAISLNRTTALQPPDTMTTYV